MKVEPMLVTRNTATFIAFWVTWAGYDAAVTRRAGDVEECFRSVQNTRGRKQCLRMFKSDVKKCLWRLSSRAAGGRQDVFLFGGAKRDGTFAIWGVLQGLRSKLVSVTA